MLARLSENIFKAVDLGDSEGHNKRACENHQDCRPIFGQPVFERSEAKSKNLCLFF
jgi:hypothetical protein